MNLKKLRTQRRLSQKTVADGVGCSPTVYSRYENGERQPSIEMLLSLSKFFGVSVDCIIGNPSNESPGSTGNPGAAMSCFTVAEVELIMAARESDERAIADALCILKNHPSQKESFHKMSFHTEDS